MSRVVQRYPSSMLVLACILLAFSAHAVAERSDRDPRFSPDGKRLAFSSRRDGNSDLYIMNADGSDVRRVTSHSAVDGAPAWSPDGKFLAFHSNRDGNFEIYTIRIEGSVVRR